jgi:hypothetical protein
MFIYLKRERLKILEFIFEIVSSQLFPSINNQKSTLDTPSTKLSWFQEIEFVSRTIQTKLKGFSNY